MRVAVLVKQVPKVDVLQMGAGGRLRRSGIDLEMNAYCRRAVSKGVELAREYGGRCTVFTLGPPSARDVLREAIAWGADDGVLVTGPEFAGSDTLATARALAAAVRCEGSFDLVITGRNSLDSDTGQVGPQLAELLELPFLGGVRELEVAGTTLRARCETDDGWLVGEVEFPAVISAAERLCDPAKVRALESAGVAFDSITRIGALDLGPGPWGDQGSVTRVGDVRLVTPTRARRRFTGGLASQVDLAVNDLLDRGAVGASTTMRADREVVPDGWSRGPACVVVVVEPDRPRCARELLGAAAGLARDISGAVTAIVVDAQADVAELSGWGADRCVLIPRSTAASDAGAAVAEWCEAAQPWAVLVPGTMWGREVAGRTAARLTAGLTGDAVELSAADGRLVAWKPALGGAVVTAITATTAVQLATVRPGVLAEPAARRSRPVATEEFSGAVRGRVRVLSTDRNDELEPLAAAEVVVGVGRGVAPDEYGCFDGLLRLMSAELGATRKVTDAGWLPRARQIGITGRAIAPRLYLAFGIGGSLNHVAGLRGAGTVLAVNSDPEALIFDHADIGIVGGWREVVPMLTSRLEDAVTSSAAPSGVAESQAEPR